MTATLTAPVEALRRKQVAKGHFPSMNRALKVAVKTVDGRRASHALESLLDEALSPPGERAPSRNCAGKRHEAGSSRERIGPPGRPLKHLDNPGQSL